MFRRWVQTLLVVLLLLVAFAGLQYYFVDQRYDAYEAILKDCDFLEEQMLKVPDEDWANSAERAAWEYRCDHSEGSFSDAKTAYSVYSSLSDNFDFALTLIGLVLAVVAGSFLGRWIFKGNIKLKE